MSQTYIMDSVLIFFNRSAGLTRNANALLFSFFMVFATGCQKQSPENLYSLSLQSFEQKNYEEASIHIKNAIQLAPKNAEYRALLARIYIENRNWNGAEKELNKAIEFGFSGQNLVKMQSLINDKLAKYDDQLTLDIGVSEGGGNSGGDQSLYLKLKAYYMLGDSSGFDEFFPLFEGAFENASYRSLARAMNAMNQNNWDIAKGLIEDTKTFDSETRGEALTLLARVARQLDDSDLLVNTLEVQLLNEPLNHNVRIELVSLYVFLKQFVKAEAVLEPIEKHWLQSKEISRWRALTSFYNQKYSKGYESAKNAIGIGLNTLEQNAIAGISAFKLEKYEDAQHYLEFVISELPSDNNFRVVLAQTYLMVGDSAASYKLLQNGGDGNEGYRILKLHALQKALSSGFTSLVQSLTTEEEGNKTLSSIPSALLKNTQNALEKEAWNESQWLYWGAFQIESGKQEVLENTCLDMKLNNNTKFVGLLLCAQHALSQQNAADAEIYLNEAKTIDGAHPELHFLAAQISNFNGNVASAKMILKQSLSQFKSNISTLIMYADLANNDEQEAAIKFIETANSIETENQQLQTLLVTTLFKYQKFDRVLTVVDDRNYNENWENGVIASLYGRSLVNTGKYRQAKAYFLEWISHYPQNTEALYGVLNTLDATNEFLEALSYIEKYLATVDDDNIRVYQAYFLSLLSRNRESARVLKSLPEASKNLSIGLYALASNALFEGKTKLAATLISRAYATSSNLRNLFLYGQILDKLGKAQEIDSLLTSHISQFEYDLPAVLMLATRVEKSDEPKAIGLYEHVLGLDSNNKIAMNNLAYLFINRANLEKAKPLVEQLETVHDSFAEGLDTVALYYLNVNELDKSVVTLEKALRLQPNNPHILRNYIERLTDSGDVKKAKRVLDRNEEKLERADVNFLREQLRG